MPIERRRWRPILVIAASLLIPALAAAEDVRIRATVAWVKDKTFRMEYEIAVDGRACASGFEVRAWVGRPSAPGARLEAKPIPDQVARLLRGDPQ